MNRWLIILLALVAVVKIPLAQAERLQFVDDRNLISAIETKVDDLDKSLVTLTMKVYTPGKENPNNRDPIDRLVIVKNDAAEFIVIEGEKTAPETFVFRGVPGGVWEIQTDDLTSQVLDRAEVDYPHSHNDTFPSASTPTVIPTAQPTPAPGVAPLPRPIPRLP